MADSREVDPYGPPPKDPLLLAMWVRAKLALSAPKAVDSIIELAHMADSEQVRLQARKDLLGLIGVSVKQQVEVDHGLKREQAEVDAELDAALEKLSLNKGGQHAIEAAPTYVNEGEAEVIDAESEVVPVPIALEEDSGIHAFPPAGHTSDVPLYPLRQTPPPPR